LLFKLLDASDFDLEAANRGIIYADGLRDETAQQAFVDLVDGAARRTLPNDVKLNVERTLFICGAEAACDEIGSNDPGDVRQSITNDDLTTLGMLPDFVNRLHLALWWNPLVEETLVRIMSNWPSGKRELVLSK
jgi:ATP-dependent protease Clp ATPase subunit